MPKAFDDLKGMLLKGANAALIAIPLLVLSERLKGNSEKSSKPMALRAIGEEGFAEFP